MPEKQKDFGVNNEEGQEAEKNTKEAQKAHEIAEEIISSPEKLTNIGVELNEAIFNINKKIPAYINGEVGKYQVLIYYNDNGNIDNIIVFDKNDQDFEMRLDKEYSEKIYDKYQEDIEEAVNKTIKEKDDEYLKSTEIKKDIVLSDIMSSTEKLRDVAVETQDGLLSTVVGKVGKYKIKMSFKEGNAFDVAIFGKYRSESTFWNGEERAKKIYDKYQEDIEKAIVGLEERRRSEEDYIKGL